MDSSRACLSVWFLVACVGHAASGPSALATGPDMKPGAARPWGADMSVATYSSVNLWDGNLLTAIPIIGWNGVGPDMQMVLYHNSANVDSALDLTRGMGFDMGPGWTCTFSGHIIYDDQEDTALVIHDDGTQDLYEWNGGTSEWDPPTGVYAVLTRDGMTDEWTLTFENQTYRHFDDEGLLLAVGDSCGNEITVVRETVNSVLRIDYVYDAAGRTLDFDYGMSGRLRTLEDPACGADEVPCGSGEPGGSTLTAREWDLDYTSQRVETITDPESYVITITYDGNDRIDTIEDKDEHAFDYDYNGDGRLTKVTDPTPSSPLDQDFSYSYTGNPPTCATVYTDRRGNNWDYDFDASERIYKTRNPLDKEREFTWDGDNNLTDFYNELDDQWEFTYDARGNVLKVITPLTSEMSPKVTYTYDALNNVTSVTDGEGNTVGYNYDSEDCSTILTSIELPPDGEGNGAAEIELTYYEGAGELGLLKDVLFKDFRGEDEHVVLSHYEYDDWGQIARLAEGLLPQDTDQYGITMNVVYDSGSRGVVGPGGDSMLFNNNNNATGSECIPILSPGDPSTFVPTGFPAIPGCALNDYTWLPDGGWTAEYNGMGQVTELTTVDNQDRERTNTYDELGRLVSQELDSAEAGAPTLFERNFGFEHDWAAGEVTVSGPDGDDIVVEFDAAGRVETVTREDISAEYDYYDDGQVSRIDYGNDTYVLFTYDDDGRLASKQHFDDSMAKFLGLAYTYDGRDLPTQIVESNASGTVATTTFEYDDRGRLIAESRVAAMGVTTPEYDMEYDYDQMGNRIEKRDNDNEWTTVYHYDVDDPEAYDSDNNRLMYYTVSDFSTQLISTTWYYYDTNGNPTRIITELGTSEEYTAVRFVYDKGRRVAAVAGERWTEAGACDGGNPVDYERLYVREFRYEYDEPRAKYLTVERDCDTSSTVLSRTWTDYLGGSVYGDYEVTEVESEPVYTELVSFMPGIGSMTLGNTTTVKYEHSDHLGTLRALSDSGGDDLGAAVYTAFGERIDGGNHRYGYVGAHGYRAHEDYACDGLSPAYGFPYLHVGFRYYDPASGRFLQRDPIGIVGGLNVYEYVGSAPTTFHDPDGLGPIFDAVVTGIAKAIGPSRVIAATGGEGETRLDRIGDNIAGRRLPSQIVIDGIVGAAGARVPKRRGPNRGPLDKITIKGPASTKSIWETRRARHITGTTIRGGMRIGFVGMCALLIDGAGAAYNIGAAVYEEW